MPLVVAEIERRGSHVVEDQGGRASSITNSFVNSLIPVVMPTEEGVREGLTILGMEGLRELEDIHTP